MLSATLAHGAVGPADEIAGLAALPLVLLALAVAAVRRRNRSSRSRHR